MATRNRTVYFYQPGQGPCTYIPFSDADDDDVRISSHCVDSINHTVDLMIVWPNGSKGQWFSEYDVQSVKPNKVYDYWRNLDGRFAATKLSKYHVFNISDEHGTYYHIQWTGYDENDGTWETKVKVKLICPRAVLNWEDGKKHAAPKV
ncbi:hypothetical protein FLONG3_5109 [Fusarium longipes]|uniref:Chromo domain-containing protein n=1 Tax=Fusarium longipes TaxID=694270 RepID=A0A395SX38_9HYPO|nr:hypothetical protein FLONG3_5109 [Fusarium longipes]